MKYEQKRTRAAQIASVALAKVVPFIRLEQSNSSMFDILAIIPAELFQFGIKVVSSSFLRTVSYDKYLKHLNTLDYSKIDNQFPILILAVNESSESVKIGIQVGFEDCKPVIFKKPKMTSLTYDTAEEAIDTIRFSCIFGM